MNPTDLITATRANALARAHTRTQLRTNNTELDRLLPLLVAAGFTTAEIARMTGIEWSPLRRRLDALGLNPTPGKPGPRDRSGDLVAAEDVTS